MKKVSILLTIILLVGCSPCERLLKKCPPEIIKDTVYLPGEIVYQDTVVYRYLAGDTVENEIVIEKWRDRPDTFITAHTELAEATARLQRNKLRLQLIQYDSLFQWKLDSAIRTHTPDTIRITDTTYFKVPTETKACRFFRSGFIVLGALWVFGMILLFLRLKK